MLRVSHKGLAGLAQLKVTISVPRKLLAQPRGFGLYRDKAVIAVFSQLFGKRPRRVSVPLRLAGHIKGIYIKTVAELHQGQLDLKLFIYVNLPDGEPFMVLHILHFSF
jgi:hypothetical protein